MNPSRNDITGDPLMSKSPTNSYRDGWDRIFGNKAETEHKSVDDSDAESTDITKD